MNFICTEESVNILNRLYGSAVIVVVWLRDIEFAFVVCSVVHWIKSIFGFILNVRSLCWPVIDSKVERNAMLVHQRFWKGLQDKIVDNWKLGLLLCNRYDRDKPQAAQVYSFILCFVVALRIYESWADHLNFERGGGGW